MLNIAYIALAMLVIAIAALLIYAATRPDEFRVERSVHIKADQSKVFPLLNYLRNWDSWSPYLRDPAMKKTYSGAAEGTGAIYAWEGNSKVGQGIMEVLNSVPHSEIHIRLTMIKPFAAENAVTFTLVPAGEMTHVTWAMKGRSPYIAKVMGVIFNMDKMVGTDFERGLEKLKNEAER